VPGGGLAGISGVESVNAAPLVGGPPGTELQTMFEGLPSGAVGEMVPVVLATIDVGIVPNAAAPGISAFGEVVVGGVLPGVKVFSTVGADGAGIAVGVAAGEFVGGVTVGAATANVEAAVASPESWLSGLSPSCNTTTSPTYVAAKVAVRRP